MRHARAGIIALVVGFAVTPLSAQEDPTPDEPMPSMAGPEVYQLAEVGGSALPFTVDEDDGCREEVTGGTLTLHEGGEWTLVIQEREVCGDRVEEDEERDRGLYTVDGDTITFLDEDGDPEDIDEGDRPDLDDLVDGTRDGDTLTVQLDDGQTMAVFRRSAG